MAFQDVAEGISGWDCMGLGMRSKVSFMGVLGAIREAFQGVSGRCRWFQRSFRGLCRLSDSEGFRGILGDSEGFRWIIE